MRNGSFESSRSSLLIFGAVALFSVATFAWSPLQVQEPPPAATAPAAQTSEPEFKLRVRKNVMVVGVVVRDSKGRAVGGLRKEDFRISDNGKRQEISSFSVETSLAASAPAQPSPAAPAAKPGPEAATPVAPFTYLAFYFDDLYSAMDSIARSREAAEKFIAGLPASERVAIFTSSGAQTLDFTDDRQKLHEVLMKLRANTRLNPEDNCPAINDYLASRIAELHDGDAIAIVLDEASNACNWKLTKDAAIMLAQQTYYAYRFQSRAVLQNLEGIIERIAAMPGERQVLLVSDGFMDLEMNNRVESVVDHALRARVTISALDGAGLTVNLSEMDVTRRSTTLGNLVVQINNFNSAREAATNGTLAEIAGGTGGQFFHNNNDLLAGLRKILMPPEVSYVLTFSPTELKADGTFHTLKVTLAHGHGLTLQARKGYFAPKGQVSPEELAKNEIRAAVSSSYPIQDLPLTFETEVRNADGQNMELAVQAQLDIRTLPFEKQGDHNLDNVVFAVGLFDHDGKYVAGSQQTYALALKDSTLAEMEKRGLSFPLKTNILVKPGGYTLRVVVRDSQGGKVAASSKAVEIPSRSAPPAAHTVVPSGPGVGEGQVPLASNPSQTSGEKVWQLKGRVTSARSQPLNAVRIQLRFVDERTPMASVETDFQGGFYAEITDRKHADQERPAGVRSNNLWLQVSASRDGYDDAWEALDLTKADLLPEVVLVLREKDEPWILPSAVALLRPVERILSKSVHLEPMAEASRADCIRGAKMLSSKDDALGAAILLETTLDHDPTCYGCRLLLGMAQLEAGAWLSAQRSLSCAVDLGTSSHKSEGKPQPLVVLAMLEMLQGDLAGAEKLLKTALVVAPADGLTLQEMGRLRLLQDRWEEAEEYLKKASKNQAPPEIHLLRAGALAQSARLPEANLELSFYLRSVRPGSHPGLLKPWVSQVSDAVRVRQELAAYGHPKSVATEPLAKVLRDIPQLAELRPAPSQAELPRLLQGIGRAVESQFRDFPNTIADEKVFLARLDRTGVLQDSSAFDYQYLYILLGSHAPSLQEYRTDSHGVRVPPGPVNRDLVATMGFAASSLLFHPFSQPGADYRLLGNQEINGHDTYVVAFAQSPQTTRIISRMNSFPFLFQGVAWIDPKNLEIIQMRLTLLKPVPAAELASVITFIEYGEVHPAGTSRVLWLPLTVRFTSDWHKKIYQNVHTYSNFRIFNVQSTIKTDFGPER